MMSYKRSRGEMEESMAVAATMAKCLMLLSRDRGEINYQSKIQKPRMPTSSQGRVYECKTCKKQFPSFQALGGHRAASHKKRPLIDLYSSGNRSINENQQQVKKQKMHECSICGLKFEMGQALGGHMRRHRTDMIESSSTTTTTTTTGLSSSSSDTTTDITCAREEVLPQMPELKRSDSSRRVSSLNLDLSLSLLPNTTTIGSNQFEFSALVKADQYEVSYTPFYSFI